MTKRFSIKAWAWPVMCGALLLTAFATPRSDGAGMALLLMGLTAIVCAAAWAVRMPEGPALSRRRQLLYVVGAAAGLAVLLLLQPWILMLTAGHSGHNGLYDPSRAVLEYLKLAGVVCAFAFGFRVSMSDDTARRCMDAVLAVGGIWAFVSIITFVADPEGIYRSMSIGQQGRLTAALSSANSAGTLFGALSVMACGHLLNRFWNRTGRLWVERIDPFSLIVFGVSLTALVMTLSRGAITVTAACLVVEVIVLSWNRVRLRWLLTGVATSAAALVALTLTPLLGLAQRLQNVDVDNQSRQLIYGEHLKVVGHQLWFGSGFGSFAAVNNAILTELNYGYLFNIRAMHNIYLQWLEECGLVGLIVLIGLNLAILSPVFLAAGRRRTMGGRLWAILLAYAVFLLHGLTDYGFQEPALEIFIALVLGQGLAIATNNRQVA